MGDDDAMQFDSIGYRHQIPNPAWYNPFKNEKERESPTSIFPFRKEASLA